MAVLADQVASRLREQILRGDFRPGSPLDSTRTLGRELGVSHGTVQTALGILAKDGLVRRPPVAAPT